MRRQDSLPIALALLLLPPLGPASAAPVVMYTAQVTGVLTVTRAYLPDGTVSSSWELDQQYVQAYQGALLILAEDDQGDPVTHGVSQQGVLEKLDSKGNATRVAPLLSAAFGVDKNNPAYMFATLDGTERTGSQLVSFHADVEPGDPGNPSKSTFDMASLHVVEVDSNGTVIVTTGSLLLQPK